MSSTEYLISNYTVYCHYSICDTNFLFRIDKRKYRTFFIAYMKTYTLMSKAKRTGTLISLDRSWTDILPTFCVTCVSLLFCIFKHYNSIGKKNNENKNLHQSIWFYSCLFSWLQLRELTNPKNSSWMDCKVIIKS